MRKSTIAIGIAAALSTPAFVSPTNANAAVKVKPQKASGPVHSQPHFKYPNNVRPNGSTVLYDQTGTVVNGAPSQNFESAFDAYDAQGADDFVVTDAAGWTLSAFNFVVSATADPSSATYDIEVYPDNGGLPGASAVCSYPAATGVLTSGNTALSVALPTPCSLSQGTYWVEMVVNLDFGTGGQVFWSDYSPGGTGANSKWQNPGGGFGTSCSTWSDLATCVGSTSPVGGGQTAFMFQVVGAVGGGGGGCGAGQFCLVSTVGTDTSPGACGTADTIDATVGDQLNFCYTVTNNTGVELDYHTLENNVDGVLFSLLNQPLPDGATFQYNHIETVNTTNTYNSTWTAQDVPPGYAAEVTGGGGGGDCSDRIFADGFDGTPLPCPGGTGGFIDISGTGTPLGLSDDGSAAVTMPFSFNFYGSTSNQLSVSNNGGVLFGTSGGGLPFTNISLPAGSLSAPAILPLWDDFDSSSGDVYTDVRGTSPNRQFIVEWYQRTHYSGNTDSATFEVIFNEADGTLQFEYADVDYTGANNASGDPDVCDGGVCATIGLQNDPGLYNQFSAFEAAVTNDSGILWSPTNPQVFTGTDSVTVNVGAPNIVVNDGNPITGTVPAGGTNSVQFPIANTGDRDLNWSLTEAGPANLHFPPPGSRYAPMLGDPSQASARPVPAGLRTPRTKDQAPHGVIRGPGTVPMFAADIYNNTFVTLDALNPGTVNTVASTDGTAWTGGAFIDGDFSKLYVLSGSFAANPDQFATIDTATGAKTVIGSSPSPGGAGWNGMAYDSTTGIMYAVTGCPSGSSLYTIDINTGTPTLVGSMSNEACTVSIAIDSAGQMYGVDIVNDALYAIDKTSGSDALIGSIGFNANYAQEMTFDLSTDVLYFASFNLDLFGDYMYTVDTGTGTATLIDQIGPPGGFAELDAMGIETAGGPCSQPQDLPWLSLSPLTGTTAPGASTPVTASLDGTGASDGDVLSGTVCATSNDPDDRTVATPIDITVGGGGGGNIVHNVVNLAVPNTTTGLYFNWLTQAACTSGCTASSYTFNPWGSTTMNFFWSVAPGSACVWDGASCSILSSGATVGPASSWGAGNAAVFNGGNSSGYLGFEFDNGGTTNYGYALFTTTAPNGYPATLVEYWYDNTGAAISIP